MLYSITLAIDSFTAGNRDGDYHRGEEKDKNC